MASHRSTFLPSTLPELLQQKVTSARYPQTKIEHKASTTSGRSALLLDLQSTYLATESRCYSASLSLYASCFFPNYIGCSGSFRPTQLLPILFSFRLSTPWCDRRLAGLPLQFILNFLQRQYKLWAKTIVTLSNRCHYCNGAQSSSFTVV
ncbi:uncharacterized protein ARMOST_17821 [Armillaria ostoyae]|uniref:Uncharacterized protein n=1 Tax=Armillaria ostoyae TaxID=47428 RepID=A0A284S030_ARMOS|nr:uncharacterized protein ARMOST_17821 [Armillaria ostoyae]